MEDGSGWGKRRNSAPIPQFSAFHEGPLHRWALKFAFCVAPHLPFLGDFPSTVPTSPSYQCPFEHCTKGEGLHGKCSHRGVSCFPWTSYLTFPSLHALHLWPGDRNTHHRRWLGRENVYNALSQCLARGQRPTSSSINNKQ